MKAKLLIIATVAAFILGAVYPLFVSPPASAQSGSTPVTVVTTQGTLSSSGQYTQTAGNFIRVVEGTPTPTPSPSPTCEPAPASPGGTIYIGTYTLSNGESGSFSLIVQNDNSPANGVAAPNNFPNNPRIVEQGAATVTLSINAAAGTGSGSISFTSNGAVISGNITIFAKTTFPPSPAVTCGSPTPTPTASPTVSPTPTATPTASPTPTATPSPTVTPTPPLPTQNDFDGDGRADPSVFRPSNGFWYLNRTSSGFAAAPFGLNSDRLAPADYDGDGRTDIAVFRDGNWYMIQSSNNQFRAQFLGQAGDLPQPADFDGDKRADLAVFRPSNGTWYVRRSTAGALEVQFGSAEDQPVAADFTGDGIAELAVFRPSNGTWYVSRNFQSKQFDGIPFGAPGDRPVAADYDGDRRTDFAVFRPSNGTWYLLRSTQGFTATVFGAGSDTPAPADYDGDGRADIAVFRNGDWFMINSSNNQFRATRFGQAGDRPIQAAYIP